MSRFKKVRGRELHPLKEGERKGLYEHILYELASAFCPPSFHEDEEVKESVFQRVLVAFRNLKGLFVFYPDQKYYPTDVFAWQFFEKPKAEQYKFTKEDLGISKEDIDKVNAQIMHITKNRIDYTGHLRRWNVELTNKLWDAAYNFSKDLIRCRANEMDRHICRGFQQLNRFFSNFETYVVPDLDDSGSNTSFDFIYERHIHSNAEPIRITDILKDTES